MTSPKKNSRKTNTWYSLTYVFLLFVFFDACFFPFFFFGGVPVRFINNPSTHQISQYLPIHSFHRFPWHGRIHSNCDLDSITTSWPPQSLGCVTRVVIQFPTSKSNIHLLCGGGLRGRIIFWHWHFIFHMIQPEIQVISEESDTKITNKMWSATLPKFSKIDP